MKSKLEKIGGAYLEWRDSIHNSPETVIETRALLESAVKEHLRDAPNYTACRSTDTVFPWCIEYSENGHRVAWFDNKHQADSICNTMNRQEDR